MENQNNHRRIPALGIVIDSVSVPRAVEISQKFFYNDYFNFVLFAGSWLALESQTSDEIRKFISEADLILPGDHNIEKVAEQESEESFQALYLDGLLSALAQMEGHVCVLCETEQIEEDIVNNILEDYPGLTVECVLYEQDDEEALEALVNKINGYFPDLVLPIVSLEKQQSLLLTHKETLSTKLFIGSETLFKQIIEEPKESSVIVKWLMNCLHLGKKAIDNEFWQKYNAEKENTGNK